MLTFKTANTTREAVFLLAFLAVFCYINEDKRSRRDRWERTEFYEAKRVLGKSTKICFSRNICGANSGR